MNLPLGYAYAATYAGIRAAEKDDLALIVTGLPATAAAVFTQNRVQAAPVRLAPPAPEGVARPGGRDPDQRRQCQLRHAHRRRGGARHLPRPLAQTAAAAGGAGAAGIHRRDRRGTGSAARSSTRCRDLVGGAEPRTASTTSARAIMTTDLVPKTAFAEVKLRRGTVRIAGMTKGSGMIQPQMATTLGFVMTDAQHPGGAAARHAEARRRAQLQPHLGGRRHLHQRHAAAAGQRRLRRAAGPEGIAPRSKRRSRACWNRWRSRSRATAKARRS